MTGIPYRDIITAFMDAMIVDYPLIAEIRDFFLTEAAAIQQGGPEYVFSENWLSIYWPADEYIYIKLTEEKLKQRQFYRLQNYESVTQLRDAEPCRIDDLGGELISERLKLFEYSDR